MNAKDKLKRDPVWRRILESYKAEDVTDFTDITLCNVQEFRDMWDDDGARHAISCLAVRFLASEAGYTYRQDHSAFVGTILLFNLRASREMHVGIRVAFLEYLIAHERETI